MLGLDLEERLAFVRAAYTLSRLRTIPGSPRRSSRSLSRHRGHALRLEVVEGAAIALALAQDRDPGKAGLRALQAEQLEERALVVQRDPHSSSW